MFPEASSLGVAVALRWRFIGNLTGSKYLPRRLLLRRLLLRRRALAESEFDLDLVDVSGEAFGYDPKEKDVSPDVVRQALDHLAGAQGLIYLFDPLTERNKRTAAAYLNRTLTELSHRISQEGRTIGPYLPHHISVCVTKFDDPKLFQQARQAGFVNYGRDGMPRVLDEHAEDFFNALCDGKFWGELDTRSYAGAMYVRSQLKQYFHPDRIRYYVTSSIGYRTPPGWDPADSRFNPDDYANVNDQERVPRIRGAIRPVNVLEPLIALQMRLTGRA